MRVVMGKPQRLQSQLAELKFYKYQLRIPMIWKHPWQNPKKCLK